MLRVARTGVVAASRSFATAQPKAPVKLIAELQRATNVSLSKAAEALAATNNDLNAATKWLEEDIKSSGAARAAKLAGRTANEGAIALSVLSDGSRGTGIRAALVELACETDFVSRGDLFSKLAADIANTAAFFAEPSGSTLSVAPVDLLAFGSAPCIGPSADPADSVQTVTEAIHATMAKVSENLSLRRAVALVAEPGANGIALGSYVHGATSGFPSLGRIGCITTVQLAGELPQDPDFEKAYSSLRRALARQIVGMNVETVTSTESISQPDPSSSTLYHQPFVMLPGASESETVEQALQSWGKKWNVGVSVNDFIKWTRNETSTS